MKFELTEANTEAGLAILKITEGEFNGVEFAYKTVQFHEDESGEGENCRVELNFDVTKSPDERSCQDIEKMVSFQEILGDILSQILVEQFEHNEQQQQPKSDQPNS